MACSTSGAAGDTTSDSTAGGDLETVSGDQVGADLTLPEVTADVPEPGDATETIPDISQPDLGLCPFGCPPGYCDEDSGQCLYCMVDDDCPIQGQWCKEDMCVTTFCIPGEKKCLDPLLAAACLDDGEAWDETACSEGFGCWGGECLQTLCNPGEYHCENGLKVQCLPNGSGHITAPCPPGMGCFEDECELIDHNLLVIFDTSGSMASMGFLDTVPCICPGGCSAQPFPQCEDANCPQSKLGMSKYVFNKFFQSEQLKAFSLVLTRFADRIKHPPVTSCNDLFSMGRGWYGLGFADSNYMTGDDGSHVTGENSYFEKYLHEIMCVPFPKTFAEDNFGLAQKWVNFDEAVGPTAEPCTSHPDCPGGFCANDPDAGAKVCWYHTDPELRALGNTPLGRSMFYAGEVYRKQVVINGKSCETDEDCGSRNYYCKDGKCKDPFGPCRTNMILLFTDGVEEPPTELSDFFNPRIQAKRFRYGLGCDIDDDCFDGATCQGGVCKGYPHPYTGGSEPYNTDTPWRLDDYHGDPIMVTTHVIDLSQGDGAHTNKQIAEDGGGSYYHASDLDPDDLLELMYNIIDIKQNLADCVPEYD